MNTFILSGMLVTHPVPFVKHETQIMMLSPPCFTVGMVLLGCKLSMAAVFKVAF